MRTKMWWANACIRSTVEAKDRTILRGGRVDPGMIGHLVLGTVFPTDRTICCLDLRFQHISPNF
jgi:hypothetical protein